ncbi:MAG: 2-succinyl-6-hydroxy-2,4-cyclohexadiene-1-carboxylate synthase [Anaerolineae bacterium]|nr:2-succinyl-6-hydroxy-2,4-cyclohexadiene-1-carboxylate synthase [Anaerolineae bacterium]
MTEGSELWEWGQGVRRVALGDATYGYVEQGEGEALLLLHGFTGSSASWQRVLPELAEQYRVIAVDLLGHGVSDAPSDAARYRMVPVAADIAALLDHLEVARAHLLGYSMGGRLALYLALLLPARWRSLILESSSPGLATPEERAERAARDEELAAFIEAEGIEPFVDDWEQLPLFASQQSLPAAIQAKQRRMRLRNRPAGLAGSLRGMGTGVQPSLWARLGELALPTLLLAGALDEKFVGIAQKMARVIPGATLAMVPDAGHTIHLEQTETWLRVVTGWLGERESS